MKESASKESSKQKWSQVQVAWGKMSFASGEQEDLAGWNRASWGGVRQEEVGGVSGAKFMEGLAMGGPDMHANSCYHVSWTVYDIFTCLKVFGDTSGLKGLGLRCNSRNCGIARRVTILGGCIW